VEGNVVNIECVVGSKKSSLLKKAKQALTRKNNSIRGEKKNKGWRNIPSISTRRDQALGEAASKGTKQSRIRLFILNSGVNKVDESDGSSLRKILANESGRYRSKTVVR